MSNSRPIKKAFSLIEVLIFITILSLFLITSVAIVTVSMRQNALKIRMLDATFHNEQLLNWIRDEKEVDWNTFVSNASNYTYCFNNVTLSTWPATAGACAPDPDGYDLDGIFKRYVTFTPTTSPDGIVTKVTVLIHTDWRGEGTMYTTKLETVFTVWE